MYRLFIAHVCVIAPLQVGMAATLVAPSLDASRIDALKVMAFVGLTLCAIVSGSIYNCSASEAAYRARLFFFWLYCLPIFLLIAYRLTLVEEIRDAWKTFCLAEKAADYAPSHRAGNWNVEELAAKPGTLRSEAKDSGTALAALVVKGFIITWLRIVVSTPFWSIVVAVIVAWVYRPKPEKGKPK